MLNKKAKKEVRRIIRNFYGHCNLEKIRQELKKESVNEYGCSHIRKNLGEGVQLLYTSNPNHFCRYGVMLQKVGMVSTLALTAKDFTPAGRKRIGVYIDPYCAF